MEPRKRVDLSKTELWVAIAGLIAVVSTAVLQSGLILQGTAAYGIIGIVVTVATYIGGRSWVKAAEAKAKAPQFTYQADERAALKTRLGGDGGL